ncbi:MAG: diguanylate cyclase, partial [Acidimicrobiales bacterium]
AGPESAGPESERSGSQRPASPSEAGRSEEIQRYFWLKHMRIGFGVFLGETIFVMVYLGLTPRGPHRLALWVVTSVWFVCGVTNLLLTPRLAASRWRTPFSASWTIVAAFAVGGVAYLDGGLISPILLLLFLPAAFAAVAFTPKVAGACGVATLLSAGGVAVAGSSTRYSAEGSFVLFAVLAGSLVLSVAASVNRAQRERHEQVLTDRITELATTDGLTGCAVHRVFHERLGEEIARSLRYGAALSLMLIDVDAFKAVNDTYGHLVGDHVLEAVGRSLRTQCRTVDLVGRLGGDEFAVLLPDTGAAAAAALAERIRRHTPAVVEVPITLSIGVSELDRSSPTAERMVDDADMNLYRVKRSGRDGVAGPGATAPVAAAGPTAARGEADAVAVPSAG